MSKALSWICSALVAATSVSVTAAPQKAAKVTAKPNLLTMSAQTAPKKSIKDPRTAQTLTVRPINRAKAFRQMDVKVPMRVGKSGVLAQSTAQVPDLVANMVYSETWTETAYGLYNLPKAAGEEFEFTGLSLAGNMGGVLVDGIYYTTEFETFWGFILAMAVHAYDVESGEEVFSQDVDLNMVGTTQVYDAATATVYGVFYNEAGDGYTFSTVDYEAGTQEVIADIAAPFYNLAIASDGQLYAMMGNGSGSALVKVDKATGETTLVGTNDIFNQYITSGFIDPKTNVYYFSVSNDDEAYLATINLADGSAERLFDYPNQEEVVGMYLASPSCDDGAPAAVTDLRADFIGAELSGTVAFKCPTTTFDGNAAEGTVTYTVKSNGEEIATGEAAYGAEISVPVTVANNGTYTFTVSASNEVGEGPSAKVKLYIGQDLIKAPAEVTATYADGKMTISWPVCTEGVNGGYIDADGVRYIVSQLEPTTKILDSEYAENTMVLDIEEPETLVGYKFMVSAKYNGSVSASVESNPIVIGSVVPPYSQDFADADAMQYMTVVDANGDGKTWTVIDGSARVSYNASMDMDDWLFTAPLKLEAGKIYRISYRSWSQGSYYPERMEVKIGNQPVADMMTGTLAEAEVITEEGVNRVIDYAPATSGIYYIGFHGISDADMFYLWLDDIYVAAGVSDAAPAQPEELAAVGAEDGTTSTTITIKTPSTALNGETLASLEKVVLYRDDTVINEFTDVAPNTEVTYTDQPEVGYHTYSAVAYNEAGAGLDAKVTVYCGVNLPVAVTNANIVETETLGEVTISWDPVTVDINGKEIPAGCITYNIFDADGEIVADALRNTTFTTTAVGAGEQDFVMYIIKAETMSGEGAAAYTPMIAVGTPSEGFYESFADCTLAYPLAVNTAGGASVGLYADGDLGIYSQDGDNGWVAYNAQYVNYYAELITGKIAIGAEDQGISLYMYKVADADENILEVYIREVGETDYTILTTFCNADATEVGWNKFNCSLADYENKVVEVKLRGTVVTHVYIIIDNIRIGSQPAYDLGLSKIEAPASVKAGDEYTVAVKVANQGMKAATGYNVNLYADGELVETVAGEEIVAGAAASFEFKREFSAVATEAVTYYAEIVWAEDLDNDNNKSVEVTVTPVVSSLPAVTDLNGEVAGNTVELTWSEPNIEGGVAMSETEDFESGDAFAQEFEGWTFLDQDGSEVGGFQGIDLPGIEPGQTTASFFVFDNTDEAFNETFNTHSGTKCLAALFRYDDGTTDDWAVSPVLSGNAQTISFFARSYSSSYPEKIEVYYSTGSLNPEDFVKVDALDVVPVDWTLVEFDVPAGASYFAIRSCATGSFMLLIDDVTFESADGATRELSIVGYNVFCDGVQVNDQPVEECEYTAAIPEDGKDHAYAVTVVYDLGQSASSNVVTVRSSGIADAAVAAVKVVAVKGQIIITGAEGQNVAVIAADGRAVCTAVAEATTTVEVNAGVYVVTVGKQTFKVMVR